MFNQPTTSDPSGENAFLDGKDVFDVSGEKVGSVSWQNRQAGYLAIQKGWLFANEVYVPFSAVVSQDSRGLFLNLSKEDLKDDRWKVPPSVPEVEASAVHSPMAAHSAAEAGEPIAPAPPLMERPVRTSEPGETFTPAQSPAQDTAQPLPIPPREGVVTDDGRPVDDRHAIADEQPVAVEIAPDLSDADPDQSSPDLNALEHPLPDEQPVDEDMASASSGPDFDQSSPSDDLNAAAQPQHDEPSVDENAGLDSSPPEADQSSPSVLAQTPEEQPLPTTAAEGDFGKRSNEIEQRVLDRMEGAAAGVAATQTSTRAAASMEEHRSGAALRAALLVGFDVALNQDAARYLAEQSPRGGADSVSELLAKVGPADMPTLAPLLAAAWRAALAVAVDNPSAASEARQVLERLARD